MSKHISRSWGVRSRQAMLAALCAGALMPLTSHSAEDSAPIQATWKTQEIRYTYNGFTTAYDCDSAERILKSILIKLGAHPDTKVLARGCDFNRPSRTFFVTITTITPIPLADAPTKTTSDQSREELLKRLGVAPKQLDETFPAEWKTIALSKDRKLDLDPGDCELMEGLKDNVLPKLSIKIITDRVHCIPRQTSLQTPELTVSALVALPKADETTKPNK